MFMLLKSGLVQHRTGPIISGRVGIHTHSLSHTLDIHRCTQTTPTTHEPLLKNASMYQSHAFCLTAGSRYAQFEVFILHTQMTNVFWLLNDYLIVQNHSRITQIKNPSTVGQSRVYCVTFFFCYPFTQLFHHTILMNELLSNYRTIETIPYQNKCITINL